ncbi:MAG: AAA family ATPase [Proteobacteria bacterium]|nr:AAA family ATPase [Pseudomonadota bacterium]
MRLERLLLHDVGPFADLDIQFRERPDANKADLHMFVGPNGSGKSTILYALAQMFSHETVLLARRLGSDESYASIESNNHAMAAIRSGNRPSSVVSELLRSNPRVTLSDGPIDYYDRSTNDVCTAINYYRYRASGPLPEPAHFNKVAFVGSTQRPPPPQPLSFAAFAYSGGRTVDSYALEAIQELGDDPLAGALSFTHTVDSRKLTQWIANAKAKWALALARGEVELAKKRTDSIERVENIIGRIIKQEIRFILEEEPLAVKVSLNGLEVELDVLPDGLKSILSWVADVLMRLDLLKWHDDTPAMARPFVLLLDEIEIHLHPAWQRQLLPIVQELFCNAQVFLSTHSPFVVSSVSDAWIYPLRLTNGKATACEPLPSRAGDSYTTVLSEVFGVEEEFDIGTEQLFDTFHKLRNRRLTGDESVTDELNEVVAKLRRCSVETRDIVERELRQLQRRIGREV